MTRGYPFLSTCTSIAIVGAGGVVPSVIEAVRRLSAKATITVFARDPKKARAALQQCDVIVHPLADLPRTSPEAIICAISADRALPLPKAKSQKSKANRSIAIDLRYGAVTKFMEQAKRKGYRVYDGRAMLIHQALRQFEYFIGKRH